MLRTVPQFQAETTLDTSIFLFYKDSTTLNVNAGGEVPHHRRFVLLRIRKFKSESDSVLFAQSSRQLTHARVRAKYRPGQRACRLDTREYSTSDVFR